MNSDPSIGNAIHFVACVNINTALNNNHHVCII